VKVGGWRESDQMPLMPQLPLTCVLEGGRTSCNENPQEEERSCELIDPKKVMACRLPRPQAGTVKTTFTLIVGGRSENRQLRLLPLLPLNAMIVFRARPTARQAGCLL